jgi:hypothetical protein
MRTNIGQKILILIILISAVVFVVNSVALAVFKNSDLKLIFRPKGGVNFERSGWNSSSPLSCERFSMVDSLLDSNALIGLNVRDVRRLIGNPDRSWRETPSQDFYVYILGACNELPSTSWWLPVVNGDDEGNWALRIKFSDGSATEAIIEIW